MGQEDHVCVILEFLPVRVWFHEMLVFMPNHQFQVILKPESIKEKQWSKKLIRKILVNCVWHTPKKPGKEKHPGKDMGCVGYINIYGCWLYQYINKDIA